MNQILNYFKNKINKRNDFLIIDNFFKNPEKVIKIAENQKFYTSSEHPYNIFNFPGVRTTYINEFDYELFEDIQIKVKKAINQISKEQSHDVWNWFSFSKTYENLNRFLPAWHKDFSDDKSIYYVGVCYLNKNPPKNTGTIVRDISGKEHIIKNKFNRFLIYSNNLYHTCQGSFDNRMVLTHATKVVK